MSHLAGISPLPLLPCSVCAGSRGRSHRPRPHPVLSMELSSEKEVPGRWELPVCSEVTGPGVTDSISGARGTVRGKCPWDSVLCCHGNRPGLRHQIWVLGLDAVPIISGVSGYSFKEKSDTDAPISHIYPRFLSDIFPPVAFPQIWMVSCRFCASFCFWLYTKYPNCLPQPRPPPSTLSILESLFQLSECRRPAASW